MSANVDEETTTIVKYLAEHEPRFVRQVEWMSHPILRLIDLLTFGSIGRLFLAFGRRAQSPKAIGLLSRAIATSSSKKVMAKALFYRGAYLYDGAADADRAIADYSLAIWCDPNDCWARKNRATIFELHHASYGRGDSNFSLPVTHAGACADAEAAIAFFRSVAGSHPSAELSDGAMRMVQQCEEVLRKLSEYK